MPQYLIAGIVVEMNPLYDPLKAQSIPYAIDKACDADVVLEQDDASYIEMQAQNPHLTVGECEYIKTGNAFYRALLAKGGMLLHSSAVVVDGKAYLFSAPSGTGKSTHTALWLKKFGDKAFIINDDKPALFVKDGVFCVSGTPWSGKTSQNVNVTVPIGAIAFLHRSADNVVERISALRALPLLLDQTIRPKSEADKLFDFADRLLSEVPVYSLGCNMDIQAATVAYNAMKGTDDED